MSPLIDRREFDVQVSRRSGGLCVLCGNPGTAAHHILDRKLFPDGGYRLANGAYVCDPCHWDCETTKVDADSVRRAAGIQEVILPPGFDPSLSYDKWGNELRPDGMRTPGPLADDTGCRRALAKGGYLGLLLRERP